MLNPAEASGASASPAWPPAPAIPPAAAVDEVRVDFLVGALRLRVVSREPALTVPLRQACAGFTPGALAAAVTATITVDLNAAPAAGLPELPRLAPRADGEALGDDSEGWRLTLSPAARGVARATAHLRRWREDAGLWRLQLEGLVRVVAATLAPAAGGALIHGCAMVAPGGDRAALFVGRSGDGKTTMTRRLPGWRPLADDTVWIGRDGAGWHVAGSPFAGKERLPRRGEAVPLAAIFTLAPAAPLALVRLAAGPAFFELVARALWFAPGWSGTQALWELLAAAAERVPVWRLASRLEDDLVATVTNAVCVAEVPCSAG